MGLIGIFKPLSTVLSSAINESQQHQEENSWELRETNQGLLGEKQVCHLCAMQPPPPPAGQVSSLKLMSFWVVVTRLGEVYQFLFLGVGGGKYNHLKVNGQNVCKTDFVVT